MLINTAGIKKLTKRLFNSKNLIALYSKMKFNKNLIN